MVEKNSKKKKIQKIGPKGTGKLVVEVSSSQVVLWGALYCPADAESGGLGPLPPGPLLLLPDQQDPS